MAHNGKSKVIQAGFRDAAPIAVGVIPFGLITGAAAAAAGLSLSVTSGMSLIVFAGASQLAAIDLLSRGSAWPVILVTMLIINLRFVMYSAVLAPHFARLPLIGKLGLAGVLTDQAFAVTIARHERQPSAGHLVVYYLAAAWTFWMAWQISTVVGVVLGAAAPASWQLEFSMPLMFLALLVPLINSRAGLAAALTAAMVAVVGSHWPGNSGMMVATLAGLGAGTIADRRNPTKKTTTGEPATRLPLASGR